MPRTGNVQPRVTSAVRKAARALGNPLDFIVKSHAQLRDICGRLQRIGARDPVDELGMTDICAYLREEFPLHLADEDESLFPLMLRRCADEDEIGQVIAELAGNHAQTTREAADVVRDLGCYGDLTTDVPSPKWQRVKDFARHVSRDLIVENAIILPLARVRLKTADLDVLRDAMMQRRGLDLIWRQAGPAC